MLIEIKFTIQVILSTTKLLSHLKVLEKKQYLQWCRSFTFWATPQKKVFSWELFPYWGPSEKEKMIGDYLLLFHKAADVLHHSDFNLILEE